MRISAAVEYAKQPDIIPMQLMQKGALGIVTTDTLQNANGEHYSIGMVGDVVRRTNGGWMTFSGSERFWKVGHDFSGSDFRVRLLEPGDTVTITVTK